MKTHTTMQITKRILNSAAYKYDAYNYLVALLFEV